MSENAASVNIPVSITNPDPTNATNVTITVTGATGRITSFTSPVIAAGGVTSENCVVVPTNNLLCDGNQTVTFTISGVTGGQGTPTVGAQSTHVLTVTNDDVCTGVAFVGTSSSVSESGGTTNLALAITDFDVTNPTSVTISATGATGRVSTFTTPVTFPANSGANQNCVVTLDNNLLCDGNQNVTFTITGISGGQGTAFIGANASHVLTVTDDEVPSAPVANAGTTVTPNSFAANWAAVSSATGYFLDVSLYSDFLNPTVTTLVEWNYPAATNDNVADGGIAANAAKTSTAMGATNLTFNSTGNGGLTMRADGWNSGNNTKFWQVDLETTGYSDIRVSSKQRGSNSGPRDFKLQYRIGVAGVWTDVTGGAVTVADNYTTGVLANVSLPAACDNQASVFLRWIMTSNTSVNGGTTAAGGASNIDDIVVTGRAPSFVAGYANLSVGNVFSQNVTGLSALTSYFYRVRSTGGCSTGGNSNTITVTTTAVADYYSRSSGNMNDPIWSDTPTGTAGPALWTGASTMNVQLGHTVTNTGTETVGSVNVEGALVLASGSVITLNGDELFSIGTITAADNSELALFGENVQVSVLGTPSFYDVTVNNSSSAVVDEPIRVRGTLFVEAGELEAVGALGIILQSDATGTGRLGPLDVTTTYTGNLTVERFIPAGNTNWRFLGSPVAGRTVFHWKDDFFTAGFPGSHYPEFFDPPGSGIYWPSIRQYVETVVDANINAGLIGVEGINSPLSAGKGFAAWSGAGPVTTGSFVVEVTGAPFVATTPITLPMTWTDSGNPTSDGWNLVSNPVASPIDFTLISRGADVANQYYIFDPAIGNNRAWTNGVGSGGANGIIQSSQGFWLKANGSAVTTTVSEDDKVLAPTGGVFGGDQESTLPMLRINLTNDQNSFGDESIVVFAQGTPALDAIDATKLVFAHPQAPQVTTRSTEGTDLAIDFHGEYTSAITIPVTVRAAVAGTYTITTNLSGISSLGCLTIEDLVTGIVTPLTDGASYSFTQAVTEAPVERFIIRGSAPIAFSAVDATCGGEDNGQATVVITEGPVDVTWTDGFGNVLLQQTAVEAGTTTFAGLAPGTYGVRVSNLGACGDLVTSFSIDAPFVLEAAVEELRPTSCPNTTDGALDLLVLGGTAPYVYAWSNGADTEDLVAAAGDYSLTVTDANGCIWTSELFTIVAGEGPVAGIASETNVVVDTPVAFTSTTEVAETWSWSFGDGATSTDEDPTHTYTVPGTYEVTLVATYGNCVDAITVDVTVELSTAIASVSNAAPVRAWMADAHLVVEHPFTGLVNVELLDATGRLHAQRAVNSGAGRITLPTSTLSTGIWFVRVTYAGEQQTLRVPLVR